MKNESKNLVLAIALSMVVLLGWSFFGPKPTVIPEESNQQVASNTNITNSPKNILQKRSVFKKLKKQSKFIKFENSQISGRVNLLGLRFEDLTLKNYNTEKNSSEKVKLLHNNGTNYFLELGWLSPDFSAPNLNSRWSLEKGRALTPSSPIHLRWESEDKKITIQRKITLDENFLFKVEDNLLNSGNYAVNVRQYGLINKGLKDLKTQFLILHEGPLGVFNDNLFEITYKKIKKKRNFEEGSYAGWLGFSQKYWLTALVPPQDKNYKFRISAYKKDDLEKYQIDFESENIALNPGQSYQSNSKIYAGAKDIGLIDAYAKSEDIPLFDRSIDFGMLYFLTKPIYLVLKVLFNYLENFGLAIIALTILIRLLVYPLASRSFKEITKMKALQPDIIKVREACKGDKMKLNAEIMKLYKAHKVNPMMGCVPVLIQVFVFFALYKVLFVAIDMRHAEFYGWIHDLSAPDPTNLFNLFGLLPFEIKTPLGVLPCLLCITMIFQQKLNPAPADPMQAKMMKFLPYLFLILFAGFPAGLVLYWTFSNIFSVAQQYFIMKRTEKALAKTKW
jgi:YidC/Oxa1 family membrane protein insertase